MKTAPKFIQERHGKQADRWQEYLHFLENAKIEFAKGWEAAYEWFKKLDAKDGYSGRGHYTKSRWVFPWCLVTQTDYDYAEPCIEISRETSDFDLVTVEKIEMN